MALLKRIDYPEDVEHLERLLREDGESLDDLRAGINSESFLRLVGNTTEFDFMGRQLYIPREDIQNEIELLDSSDRPSVFGKIGEFVRYLTDKTHTSGIFSYTVLKGRETGLEKMGMTKTEIGKEIKNDNIKTLLLAISGPSPLLYAYYSLPERLQLYVLSGSASAILAVYCINYYAGKGQSFEFILEERDAYDMMNTFGNPKVRISD